MNYHEFITEIEKYWDLRSRGLKKQANRFLFAFTERFKTEVSEQNADELLFQFCYEYIDELKFPGDKLPRRHLPFQLTDLLNRYLNRECEKNKMPQLRWAFQIFGKYYNPHDPNCEHNPYHFLEQAYAHEQCDSKTVELYFKEQLDFLWWGQHHFPEGCIITYTAYEKAVQTARKILSEKIVEPTLAEALEYYVKLYQIYFDWCKNDRTGDFYELCMAEGLKYEPTVTCYYSN
ncbi:MAG: hypothetical protein NC089_00190 [Bacteroides sp.]|nr:hypothetical protein [Bacteroides sp.]MCM1549369.1 hypothetical protein [Clostridium sp.]